MAVATLPRQSKVPITDNVKEGKTILFGLRREWNGTTLDYVLCASLPVSKEMQKFVLDKELGRVLGSYWRQSEYGTFLGKYSMDWIVRHLGSGLEI